LSPQAEQNPSTIIFALPPPSQETPQHIQQTPHQVEEEGNRDQNQERSNFT